MQRGEVLVRFEGVSFDFGIKKPILDGVNFTVRRGSKITLVGQNGAGKSTIFGLMKGKHEPTDGLIHLQHGLSVATGQQVVERQDLELTVREFFEKVFPKKVYDID